MQAGAALLGNMTYRSFKVPSLIQILHWSMVPLLLLDGSPVLARDMCVRRWCSG